LRQCVWLIRKSSGRPSKLNDLQCPVSRRMLKHLIDIIALSPKSPELNLVRNVWQVMRDNWLSNRVFKSYDDLVDPCLQGMEQTRRSAVAHHVHRITAVGTRALIIGIWYKNVRVYS
jgi:hypothetical protein